VPWCGVHCGVIRQALQQHLKRLHELELEKRDRRGYLAHPQREEEFRVWEDAAAWPELCEETDV